MGWLFISIGAVFEMVGVVGLRLYSQERNVRNLFIYYGGLAFSFFFLYLSFSYLFVSVAYAVFTGVGTAGAIILSIAFFGESKNMYRVLSVVVIIFGVVGLKMVS